MAMTRRDAMKAAGGAIIAATAAGGALAAPSRPKPLLFGHRGCSALRPEHTLGSYAKAIADGADYIEPDLVITKDGVLVIRHENNIVETTDVARHPEFAGRRTSKTIDGKVQTGWFVEDFTLAELKTLRAIERLGAMRPESQSYDSQFQILTWEEMIDFTAAEAAARGRVIGLVPELKHSTFFQSIGMPLEDRFLATIAAHDYTRRHPVEIQSFEIANLLYLRRKLGRPDNIRLMQLVEEGPVIPADVAATGGRMSYSDMMAPAGLRDIATYADVIAPQLRSVIPLTADGHLGEMGPIVADAHAAGLLLRVWTFRPENHFLATDFRSTDGDDARNTAGSIAEIKRYLATGIDGLFTDDPALGRAAIDAMWGA
jgi:glycerophosphoryl diester phosphodiesterase